MNITRRGFLSLLGILPVISARLLHPWNNQVTVLHGSEFVLVRGWLLRRTDLVKDYPV